MPYRDGTGPEGKGPQTGGRRGFCNSETKETASRHGDRSRRKARRRFQRD